MHEDCVMEILSQHSAEIVERAQYAIDEWNFDFGGACDIVADEIVMVLDEIAGIGAYAHGQVGGEHTWVVIPTDNGIVEVDIPWVLYENRLGYCQYEQDYGCETGLDHHALVYVFHDIDSSLVLDDLEV